MDLNLLVSLDALLQERSVTRAAQRLGLSQPSLSASLARLRRHFGDELLTRVGNGYELTPLAERLMDQTAQALTWTDRVFQTRPDFDAATAEREFTVVMADVSLSTFGRVLTDLVRRAAPGVRLRFQHSTERVVRNPLECLREVDVALLPQGLMASIPTVDLYQDRWRCLVSPDSLQTASLTRAELARRPWVAPYRHPASAFSPLNRLRAEGIEPHVEITTENFLAVPHLIAGTDRMGLVPERVAHLPTVRSVVTVVDLPFELGTLVESLWWHPLRERDAAHTWLRQMAVQAGHALDGPAG